MGDGAIRDYWRDASAFDGIQQTRRRRAGLDSVLGMGSGQASERGGWRGVEAYRLMGDHVMVEAVVAVGICW